MAESDSFFDDDLMDDSFAGAPSEDLLRDSVGSFESLDDLGGLDSDTPDAAIPQSELIAKAQEEDAIEAETLAQAPAATGAAVATKPAKKKGRFSLDTSELTIFDVALLISLIFVSLATLLMFFELRTFGNFPFDGFPWRTDKF